MTFKELKDCGIKVYLAPQSFHWVRELPKNRILAINITPFRILNKKTNLYEPKIGELYFEKSDTINGFWLSSIKDYTNFEKLSNYIMNKLIYY